jgi:hypothetical protein
MQELENKIKQAEDEESKSEFLGASILYREALQQAQKLNLSAKIKELKSKVVETSKKIDYNHLAFEQKVPTAILDDIVNSTVTDKDDLPLILKNIGHHPYLYPKMAHIRNLTQKTMPISFQIASVSTYSSDGHVLEGGTDSNSVWTAKMYGISQGFITDLYLQRILSALKEKKGLDSENLYNYIEQKQTFPSRSLPLIKRGLEAYFSNDYISALHILVPQFEGVFLALSEKLGIDIIALNRGTEISTRTKVLSENHLNSLEFKSKWSEDLCEQIKYVLFDPLGYKLRHKIAHGEIDPNECNQHNTEILVYLFIVLASRIEKKPKEE